MQCWHGGPRNPVREYVTPATAAACLEVQRESLGLVGHTHTAAAFAAGVRRPVPIVVGEPLALADGKWILNPGAVGAPVPPRGEWWAGLDADPFAWWLELDLSRVGDLVAGGVRPGAGACAKVAVTPVLPTCAASDNER